MIKWKTKMENAMATGIAVCIVFFGDYVSYCQC